MSPRPFVSIIVSNWEGEDLLPRALSSLQLSARRLERPWELIVVDDASLDGSAALVRERFPRARLLVNEVNRGFGRTTMRGVAAARGAVVVLCNNDLDAREHFLPHLVRWFMKPEAELADGRRVSRRRLFGVSARTISWWDGSPNQLLMNGEWRGGRITPTHRAPETADHCLFLQAGAAAYNRSLLLRLGGLSELYEPGYWEDYDLAYRAGKAGLVNLYDPDAVALHHGGGSMTRLYGAGGVASLRARNHLLFEWANLSDPNLVLRYGLRLALSVGREWLGGGDSRLTRALLDAAPRLPQALGRRMSRPATSVGDRRLLGG